LSTETNKEENVTMGRLSYIFLHRSATSERDGDSGAESIATGERRAASEAPLEVLWSTWRFAAVEADISFQEWCDALPAEKELAYAVHRDALRREQIAAARLAERCAALSSIAV
jgi:hypothetical protein